MASIIKGKNPRKPWTVRYWDQAKQRERSFTTKGEANDFIALFEHDRRESFFTDPSNGKIDFCQYAAQWIASLDKAPSTILNYRSSLNARIRPAFQGRSLASVANDREGVWQFVSTLDCSASRKSAILIVITGAVREARPDLALSVWLMRGAGLRVSEALAVRLDGFRDDGRTLRVHEQVLHDGSLGPLKSRKPGEHRDVPIPAWLWSRIEDHVREHGTSNGYLFHTHGRRVTYNAAHSKFLRAAKNAGLPGLTEHGLRHLYVSVLLSAGVPITDVAHFVGHKNINITHSIYGHLLPSAWDRGRQALETLD